MHETVLSLCDVKKVGLESVSGSKVRSASTKVRSLENQGFSLLLHHFRACSIAQ